MHTIFSPALLDLLPPQSREKARRLEDDRAVAHAALNAASHRVHECYAEIGRIEARGHAALRRLPGRGVTAEDRARAYAGLDDAKAELARLKAAEERARPAWDAFAVLDDARSWLGDSRLDGPRFGHFAVAPPKSKNFADTVATIRRDIAALDAEWAEVERAPAPVGELRQRMIEAVDAIAARGKPDVNPRIRGGDPAAVAGKLAQRIHSGGTLGPTFIGDGGASFFCWLLRDEIVSRVGLLLEGAPQKGALSDDARDDEFRRIAAKKLELERLEEAAITAAAEHGLIIHRRREADPRAVLEIAGIDNGE